MNDESKDFNYTVGIFDVICRAIRKRVEEGAKDGKTYGIGVYTDEYCKQELMTNVMKSTEERMQIAKSFEGVDFVFSVDTKDHEKIDALAQQAYEDYLADKKKEEQPKRFKLGFVIGSFDMLHLGHLEHIDMTKQLCEKVVAVLKTDERIHKNKNKWPKQSTIERAAVLQMMTQIHDIMYMDVDTTRQDIVNDILERFPDIDPKNIVAVFGSDLQAKEEPFTHTDWDKINVVFTPRSKEKMKIVSSTHYGQVCEENGGIHALEEREEANLE